MNVTSAVRDSSVTLPIMPKAPASVNVAGGNPSVIPAKAGIHFAPVNNQWIPAYAGMTI
jgi:hypothetical protein